MTIKAHLMNPILRLNTTALTVAIMITAFQYPNVLRAQSIGWQHTYGGSALDNPKSLHQLPNGYLICGSSASSDGDVTVNNGNLDAWLIKLDPNGSLVWEKSYGGSSLDVATALDVTTDGGCIMAGNTFSTNIAGVTNKGMYDYYVIKVDSLGAVQWQKAYGGPQDDYAYDVQQTSDGGYILTGLINGAGGDISNYHVGFGGDVWVVKLDDTGAIEWEKSLGGSERENGHAVRETPDNGFVIAGFTNSSDGDISINHGSSDGWLVKLDSTGGIVWERTYSGLTTEQFWSLELTNDGGFMAVGAVESDFGDDDFLLVKTDSAGVLQWTKSFGGSLDEITYSVKQLVSGGYIVSGRTNSNDGPVTFLHGGHDAWLIKVDDTGKLDWQKTFGGSGGETGFKVVQSSDSTLVFTGPTESADGDITSNNGDMDFWVVKLAIPLNIQSPDFELAALKVYPTRSTGVINVDYLSDDKFDDHFEIYNALGLKVEAGKLQSRRNKIDLQDLSSGIYFIHVMSNSGHQTFKFILY